LRSNSPTVSVLHYLREAYLGRDPLHGEQFHEASCFPSLEANAQPVRQALIVSWAAA
jgi:hypothetical protein